VLLKKNKGKKGKMDREREGRKKKKQMCELQIFTNLNI
jgi:hypothetical protein